MVCFQTKNPSLGKFWKVLLRKILVYFMTIWSTYFTAIGNILWPFGIFCGNLVYFSPLWYFGPIKIWQPCPLHSLAGIRSHELQASIFNIPFEKQVLTTNSKTLTSVRLAAPS
jgi:hypothetical protein